MAPVEWALLRALAARNPIAAGLAYEQGRGVFAARHDRVAAWTATPKRPIGIRRRCRNWRDRQPRASPLRARDRPRAAEGVEWLEAAGTDVCHRMAAERVVAALRAGTPPDRIAVVAPRLFEHLSGLRSALAEAGVTSRHRVRRPFAASPLARALVSLFAFALDEDGPEAIDRLVAWLRSPYSGADAAEVDTFEADMRRGSTKSRGQLMARWQGEAMQPAIALRGMRGRAAASQAAYLVKIGRERLAQASSSPPSAADLLDDNALAVLGGAAAELPDDDRPQAPRRRPARPARRALGRPRVRRAVRTGGRRRAARSRSGPRPCLRRGDRAGARGRDVAGSSRTRPVSARRPARPAGPAAAARARDDRGAAALPRRLRLRDRAIDARAPVRRRRRPRARALALLGRDAPAAGCVRADSARRHRPRAARRRRRQRARPRPPARARAPPGAVPPWRRRWAAARACADLPAVSCTTACG